MTSKTPSGESQPHNLFRGAEDDGYPFGDGRLTMIAVTTSTIVASVNSVSDERRIEIAARSVPSVGR